MSATRQRLGLQDMMFLYGETPQTMMHVGGLLPFTPPADAPPDYLRRMLDDARDREVFAPWNRKLSQPSMLRSPVQSWVVDEKFDLDYHVRRSALASPGDERELGILVSRLHSNQLDFSRPPWELHLIEGLEGGRFAIYVKIHHALVDGYSGMRILARSLSPDPDSRDNPLFFNMPTPKRGGSSHADGGSGGGISGLAKTLADGTRSVFDLTKSAVNTQLGRDNLTGSAEAPHSILNSRISRNRRFATQQYSRAELSEIAHAHGATLNDVALAIIGGGLRTFLGNMGELPDKPLVAFVPVNVRAKGDEGGGNAVGAILVPIGTDIDDPVQRLARIRTATTASKSEMQTLSRNAILAYSAGLMAPAGIQVASAFTGVDSPWPYSFNLCVSNVPGPTETLYMNGSRLEATYPVSIPMHGMALNITLQSYADTVNFGFIGCRDTLPHLQRLATDTGAALAELAEATAARKE
ncbi:wax ester/triacylglycerol synthase family O-acyltransferase [Skermania sp. ID1734]|uniref:WS/DGAT/MGAT family O-acyltransferase n=1 Tax=Skermania sp. ID1734 TaxID=2597516 RepID=UPI00117BFA5F|nr:wax ester/triacylglycerol synthase family O-acyltransferase [Skermania sp. ID1734]TSE02180.1 wax ester/triacylglycerol synthase family O-acyltransferase [Skermania sp. ID1734]